MSLLLMIKYPFFIVIFYSPQIYYQFFIFKAPPPKYLDANDTDSHLYLQVNLLKYYVLVKYHVFY